MFIIWKTNQNMHTLQWKLSTIILLFKSGSSDKVSHGTPNYPFLLLQAIMGLNKRCIIFICVTVRAFPSCSTVIATTVTTNMKGSEMIFILNWCPVITTSAGNYGRERQMDGHKQTPWNGCPSYWGWYSINQPDVNIAVIERVTASCYLKNKQHKHDGQEGKGKNKVSNHHLWIIAMHVCIA